MVKYLNAELYKVFHRKYPLGFLAFILGGITFIMFLIKYNAGPGADFGFLAGALVYVLSTGLYLVVLICDMVFSDQYKHNTLKNEVSYGVPRWRIYLGKLTAVIILSVILCVIILAFYLGLCWLMFPMGEGGGEAMIALGQACILAFPLWLGGLGFFLMLLFLVKGSAAASIIYILLTAVLGGGFLDLLSLLMPKLASVFSAIQKCLLTEPFGSLISGGVVEMIPHAWCLGLAWFGGSTLLGLMLFRRREIS